MFSLLYGSGLRKTELLKLRIKDIDFDAKTVFVFRGKGGKDRTTMLPKKLIEPLKAQIEKVRGIHMKNIAEGSGMTSLQTSLARKYPNTVKEFKWQYIFPSTTRCEHPYDGYYCRHHLHSTALARALNNVCGQPSAFYYYNRLILLGDVCKNIVNLESFKVSNWYKLFLKI
jgi:integrase